MVNKEILIEKYAELFGEYKTVIEIMSNTHAFLYKIKEKSFTFDELIQEGALEQLSIMIKDYKKYSQINTLLVSSNNSIALLNDFSNVDYHDIVINLKKFEAIIDVVLKSINPGIKEKIFQKDTGYFNVKNKIISDKKNTVVNFVFIESISDIFKIKQLKTGYNLYRLPGNKSYVGIVHDGIEHVFAIGENSSDINSSDIMILFSLFKAWVQENLGTLPTKKEFVSFENYFGLDKTMMKFPTPVENTIGRFYKSKTKESFDFSALEVKGLIKSDLNARNIKAIKEKDYGIDLFADGSNETRHVRLENLYVNLDDFNINHEYLKLFVEDNWFRSLHVLGGFYKINKWNHINLSYDMAGTKEELEYYKACLKSELKADIKLDLFVLKKIIMDMKYTIDNVGTNNIYLDKDKNKTLLELIEVSAGSKFITTDRILSSGWNLIYFNNPEDIKTVLQHHNISMVYDEKYTVVAIPFDDIAPLDIEEAINVSKNIASNLIIINPTGQKILSKEVLFSSEVLRVEKIKLESNSMNNLDCRIDVDDPISLVRIKEIKERANGSYNTFSNQIRVKMYIDRDATAPEKVKGNYYINIDVANVLSKLYFGKELLKIPKERLLPSRELMTLAFNGMKESFSRDWYQSGLYPARFDYVLSRYIYIDNNIVRFTPENEAKIQEKYGDIYIDAKRYNRAPYIYDMEIACTLSATTNDIKQLVNGTHKLFFSDKLNEKESKRISVDNSKPRFLSSKEIKKNGDNTVVFGYGDYSTKYNGSYMEYDKTKFINMIGTIGTISNTGRKITIETEFGEVLEFSPVSAKNSHWVHLSTINPQVDIINKFPVSERIKRRNKGYKLFNMYVVDSIGSTDMKSLEHNGETDDDTK